MTTPASTPIHAPVRRRRAAALAAGLAALLAAVLAAPAHGASGTAEAPREIRFAPGAATAEVRGKLQGPADAAYAVQGRAGQTLDLEARTRHTALYVNVAAPGSQEALFIGSTSGPRARVVLPDDGTYRIVVYLMRSAARRGERADYALKVSVGGTALPPLASAGDATVAGTRFHATAQVECRPPYATADARCDAGVVRRGRDGTATVELRGPGGLLRRLLFVQGQPRASDSAQSLSATRSGDTTRVSVGDSERYDIPDALLNGG